MLIVINPSIIFSQGKLFSAGEELKYVVSYGFIKFGEVTMNLADIKKEKEETILSARCNMHSYEGIPFVDLNSIFESDMIFDGKEIYSTRFKATEYHDDGIITIEYKFHYDSALVHVKKVNKGKTERDENIKINKNVRFQDGLSMFYCARLNSFAVKNYMIPVFMNEAETSVNYFFASQPEKISIALFDKDISCMRCSGTANFTGVFGLSGEFSGWFSDDEARIPIKSQLNVTIGSITLELDSFKRVGWKY